MLKILAILALLFAGLVATILTDRPLPRADFTLVENVDPITLDPQRMSYLQDFRLSYAIYETLLRWDTHSDDFHPVPALARAWDISPDKRTYTLRLDPEARWSNADPVTAHDFVSSWKRAMLPETAADYSVLFLLIRGAESFFSHRAAQLDDYSRRPEPERTREAALALRAESDRFFDQTVALRALDDHTLQITLERPTPYFLDLLAFGPFAPVHPPTVERFVSIDPASGAIRQDHGWTKPDFFVGNGPYIPADWRFKREMRLVRNPHYRDPALARSDSISIRYIEDMNTSILAFQTGALDWHADTESEFVSEMLAARDRGERHDIWSLPTFGTYFWSFNCTPTLADGRRNPFHDPRVRRAFTMSVDKDAIVRKVRRSHERVATVLVPRGSLTGFNSPDGLPYDPARARRELEAAGWADRNADALLEDAAGQPFPVVELLCSAAGPHRDVALAMGRMWEQSLGVRTKVLVKETKVYRDNLKRRDYMMARGGWYGDYLDATTFLSMHRTGDGNNDRGFSDPYLDDLLARAENEPDESARLRLLEEAERYTMEEALPVLPLWQYDQYYMHHPPTDASARPNPGGLRGISTHPRLVQYLWALEVVTDEDARAWDRDRHAPPSPAPVADGAPGASP